MLKRTLAIAAAVALLLPLGANAALARGGLPFQLLGKPAECIVTNGSYAQVTLGTSGCGQFTETVLSAQPSGNYVVTITDGAGNCLASDNAGTEAVIKPGACSTGNGTEVWVDHPVNQGIDDTYWIKGDQPETMGTDSTATGSGVAVEAAPAHAVWCDGGGC